MRSSQAGQAGPATAAAAVGWHCVTMKSNLLIKMAELTELLYPCTRYRGRALSSRQRHRQLAANEYEYMRIRLWSKQRKKYLHAYFNKRTMPPLRHTYTSVFMYLCMYLLVASLRTFLLLCRLYLKLKLSLPLPLLLLLFLSSPLWLCFTFLINKQAWQAHVLDYPACPCFALSSLAPLFAMCMSQSPRLASLCDLS